MINKSIAEAADDDFEKHKKIERNFTMSDGVKDIFETRQRLTNEGDRNRAKGMTSKIRRKLAKEKEENTLKHFEEEPWYDVKKPRGDSYQAIQNF